MRSASAGIHTRRLESRRTRTMERFRAYARAQGLLPVVDLDALPEMKLPWYEIRDQAGPGGGREERVPSVFIFDEIGGSFGVSAKRFVEDLEAIDAPRIHLRINSPGGSVFDAITIHSALMHHPATIRTYVDGIAASAASVVAMGADPYDERTDSGGIIMMPGSQMMIHDASNLLDGNAEDHRKDALFLDRQSGNIAELYRGRGGGDAEEWRTLMLAETWMFAAEAVELGLADRVHERPGPEPDESMTRSFDLTQYRYTGRAQAPAPRRGGPRANLGHDPDRVLTEQRTTPAGPLSGNHGLTAGTQSSEGGTPVTTMPLRASAETMRRDAARARQERVTNDPRTMPAIPGGRPSRLRSAGTAPSGPARSLAFPAELTAVLENRRGQELYHLHGQASVFNKRYEMWDEFGPYWEKVNERAADTTLAANPDVAFLTNHRGVTMARTTNGTLELAATTGLDTDAWLNPKRQDVSDLVIAIEDRNITEMSFAFMLDDGTWNDDFTEFEIMRFDLNRGDVSAVNYGANPYTSIAARQREMLDDLDRMSPTLGRAALVRLMRRADLDLDAVFDRYAYTRDLELAATAPPSVTASEKIPGGRSIAYYEALLLD